MTRRPALVFACLLPLMLASVAPAHAKLRVVSTLQDFASIADMIGDGLIETDSLAKGYQDPHFVDAKPSLILKLSRADLLIVAGLELEIGYVPPMLDQSRNGKIHPGATGYLDVSIGCEILQRPTTQVTRAMGDVHPYGNPHYWTDPDNGRVIARAIARKLSELDPAHAGDYAKNLATFESRLADKDKEWLAKMAPYAGAKIVTFHDSWPNFAKHFKLVVAGHIEPKPGIPPSPSHTLEIINLIETEKIRAVLVEPYFDLKTPKFIAEKTGAVVVSAYPSVGGVPEIKDYFALFDVDIDALAKALGEPHSMSIMQLLLPAFVASLILTGIHAYLGVHVVERGVIFVDLSLAQIAALGTTVAYLMGNDLHSGVAYFYSLGFTFLGAAIFSFTRVHRKTRIPQEAVIGIVYAVSAAVAILVMSKATQETEHLKEMLVGNILSVTWPELIKTAVLYALVGLFHYVFRERFLLISLNESEAERRGLSVRFWDFLFYVSFGFVVTSSVAIAGVLLVFCFLIVPSVTAMLFSARLGARLAIGWTMGALVSAIGVGVSFELDLPTGATIVATFGAALLVLAGVRWAFWRNRAGVFSIAATESTHAVDG